MRLIWAALLAVLLVSGPAIAATSPIGQWWTQDHTGVVEISACGEQHADPQGQELCGRIIGQDHPRDAAGHIPRSPNGQPHCGLVILRVSAPKDGRFRGTITNPQDGKVWNCEISVNPDGTLRLRGYVLTPLLGASQIWPPFNGHVSPACDILP